MEYPNNIYPAGFIGPLPPGGTRATATSPDLLKGSTSVKTAQPKTASAKTTQPVVVPPQIQQQSNPMALFMAMNAMQSQTKANNVLMTQRNLLLKQLYDTPLSSQELGQLDPTMKQAVQSNNRDQIDMSLRLISDQIQSRTVTIDSSVKYLSGEYLSSIKEAEDKRQESIDTVLNYSKSLGAKPSEILKALYPSLSAELGTSLDFLMTTQEPTNIDTQVIDVGGNKVLINTQTGETIKNYGGATPESDNISTVSGKPRTDAQNTALGYAQRMSDADKIITEIGGQFTGWTSYVGGMVPNILKSSERQQFEQAQRNFINAVLRKESGAAISPTEFDSAAKQYFPQPGDSTGVLAQKSANRQRVINSFLQSSNTAPTISGGTYEDYLNAIK
jgi:hypothetical protein